MAEGRAIGLLTLSFVVASSMSFAQTTRDRLWTPQVRPAATPLFSRWQSFVSGDVAPMFALAAG